jgi:hypothetical protein
MPLTIDQGKSRIVALLRSEAGKEGIKLKDTRWWQVGGGAGEYNLEASNAETGRTDDTTFSTKQLTLFEDDSEMRFQVAAKIAGLVIQLKKAVGEFTP